MRLPTFHLPPVKYSPARDCLCLLTMFPGRQAFEAWKKSTRRPRTAIQVLVAFVLRQVVSTNPDLWKSFQSAPRVCPPTFCIYRAGVCTVVRAA